MQFSDVERLTKDLPGVRRTQVEGRWQWRLHGRVVAREIDPTHLAIRTSFGSRDHLVQQFPDTFSVPVRFRKHMMVVADLQGDAGAIEDALEAAWRLQGGAG